MANVKAIVDLFSSISASPSGFALTDGGVLQQLVNLLFSSSTGLIAAPNGGIQAGATPLPASFCEVDTSTGTNTDAVILPLALPGAQIIVNNASANTITVIGQANNPNTNAGDTIAAHGSTAQAATGTGVTQATGILSVYACFTAGQWKQGISA